MSALITTGKFAGKLLIKGVIYGAVYAVTTAASSTISLLSYTTRGAVSLVLIAI